MFTQPFIQTQIKENIKAPRHWPLCGEFTGTGEFPAQRASYADNVSIWWRHHEFLQWLVLKLGHMDKRLYKMAARVICPMQITMKTDTFTEENIIQDYEV